VREFKLLISIKETLLSAKTLRKNESCIRRKRTSLHYPQRTRKEKESQGSRSTQSKSI